MHSGRLHAGIMLLAICIFVVSAPSNSAATWKMGLYSYGDQVRATVSEDGAGKYTLIFGHGGCVARILDHANSYADTLAGPFNGEETDRVLQTVLWGISDNANVGTGYPTRWNVNQAGTFENLPAETVSRHVVQDQRLEVYSVNGRQWYQHLDDDYQGSQPVSQYTRYTCDADGVLSVRTITRIPRITVTGREQASFRAYIEHWSAFKNTSGSDGFNAVATRASADGVPNWWYTTAEIKEYAGALPDYPNWPLSNSKLDGYAFTFNTLGATNHMVAAMVFGNDTVYRPASRARSRAVLNFKHWLAPNHNPGIGILPGIHLDQALPGTLVDFEYKLILRPGSSAEFMTRITEAVDHVIRPRIYEPDEAVPAELKPVKEKLNQIAEQARGASDSNAAL